MTAKKQQTMKLGEETWGEKLNRAYHRGKAARGYTYETVAEAITEAGKPIVPSALFKLNRWEQVPTRMTSRQTAYLALLLYGFDPEDFGLTIDNSGLTQWNPKTLRDLRQRFSPCTSVTPAIAA